MPKKQKLEKIIFTPVENRWIHKWKSFYKAEFLVIFETLAKNDQDKKSYQVLQTQKKVSGSNLWNYQNLILASFCRQKS